MYYVYFTNALPLCTCPPCAVLTQRLRVRTSYKSNIGSSKLIMTAIGATLCLIIFFFITYRKILLDKNVSVCVCV